MIIVVLGGTGLLGKSFVSLLRSQDIKVHSVARSSSDINTNLEEPGSVVDILKTVKPNFVINCIGYTDVKNIENELLQSERLNVGIVAEIQKYCNDTDATNLHVSTDHFYTGNGPIFHKETDSVVISNKYAEQKRKAEVLITTNRDLIVRGSFLGFRDTFNPSLCDWIFSTFKHEEKISLFIDAWSSGILTDDFANFSLNLLLDRKVAGIWNLGTDQPYTKAGLYLRILERLGLDRPNIDFCRAELMLPKHGTNLGLCTRKVARLLNTKMPSIDETVEKICLARKFG